MLRMTLTGLVLLGLISSANAAYMSGYCIPVSSDGTTVQSTSMSAENLIDVQITSAVNTQNNLDVVQLFGTPIMSTNCAGIFAGNDSPVGENSGTSGDGLLNAEDQSANVDPNLSDPTHLFDEGAFITSADWQNLDGGDVANDPGWLNLWKSDEGYAQFPTIGSEFYISDYLNVQLNYQSGTGDWSITFLDPTGLLDALSDTVFGDSFFDHLAFGFKDNNESLVLYDFDFNILNAMSLGLFDLNTPHNLAGNFDVRWLYGESENISHIGIYVRDPVDSERIGSPAPLALLGLGLITIGLTRKYIVRSIA
jgi:hypothetical protein